MPTPERRRVALLRAPGGEPWEHPGFRVDDILTGSVIDLAAPTAPLTRALREGHPVAATSPRAARWLAALGPEIPRGCLFVSGARTARIASGGGWQVVAPLEGSGGDAAARRILSMVPEASRVLYVCGRETAGTFEATLSDAGRIVDSLPVYALVDRSSFDPAELEALHTCAAVAFLAPSCLRVLSAAEPDLCADLSRRVPALCGPTTAISLRQAGWRDVRVAPEPSCSALLSLLP
jgi:uroporphyrinogen-III synthase